jgi:hypothetical protein
MCSSVVCAGGYLGLGRAAGLTRWRREPDRPAAWVGVQAFIAKRYVGPRRATSTACRTGRIPASVRSTRPRSARSAGTRRNPCERSRAGHRVCTRSRQGGSADFGDGLASPEAGVRGRSSGGAWPGPPLARWGAESEAGSIAEQCARVRAQPAPVRSSATKCETADSFVEREGCPPRLGLNQQRGANARPPLTPRAPDSLRQRSSRDC